MIIKEANVTIMIKDMNRSISFYTSIGFELKYRWGDHYAQLSAPNMILGLHPTTDEHIAHNSGNISLGFIIENFENAMQHLKDLNISFEERFEKGGKFVHFSDPDGAALYFYISVS